MVLLIAPKCKKQGYGVTSGELSAIQPNVYMGLIHRYLQKSYVNCEQWNLEADGISNDEAIEIIRKNNKVKRIGLICSGSNPSASTMSMLGAIDFMGKLKSARKDIKTFIWGGHPNSMPERTLKETGVDEIWNDPIDYAGLPMIDWSKINPNKYRAHNWHCLDDIGNRTPYAVVWTSLGCPYKCDFCCVSNLFNRYITRSMRDVVNEIDYLVKTFHVKHIKIMDELFVTKHPRIDEFCSLLAKRKYDLNMWCFARVDTVNENILAKLKSVGMNWIAYGFESVNQNILDGQNKRVDHKLYDKVIKMTRDAGINIIADVIAGFWDDDYATLESMYNFLVKHNFEFVNLYPLFAYPGTSLYKRMISDGRFDEPLSWEEYSLYGYECVPCRTNTMSSGEVLYWRDNKFNEYISREDYKNMIFNKFGENAGKYIDNMSKYKLRRRINENICCHANSYLV